MHDQVRCAYCDAPAEHDDHLLPKPWTGTEWRKRVETVPACRECNLLLSDKLIPGLADRRWFLLHAVRRRHAVLLKGRSWSEEEIASVGLDLAHRLRRREADRRSVLARLAVLGSTAPPAPQHPVPPKVPRPQSDPAIPWVRPPDVVVRTDSGVIWPKGHCHVCGREMKTLNVKYCPGACRYEASRIAKEVAKQRDRERRDAAWRERYGEQPSPLTTESGR